MNQSRSEQKETLINYPVYFVESTSADGNKTDETVLVAIDVQLGEGYVEWFDTVKERRLGDGNVQKLDDGSLRFTDQNNGFTYTLRPLSLALYNQAVRPKLFESRIFEKVDDMWNALLGTKADAW
jgi:hypothetical protein